MRKIRMCNYWKIYNICRDYADECNWISETDRN